MHYRPLFSQGDVAVGRITRLDVAQVLVSVLDGNNAAAAAGKTMEVLALSGTKHTKLHTDTLSPDLSSNIFIMISLLSIN